MEEKPGRRRGELLMGQQRWSPIRQKPGSVSSTASRREGKYEHLKELSGFFFFFVYFLHRKLGRRGGLSQRLWCAKSQVESTVTASFYFKDESLSGFLASHWYGMMIGWCQFYVRKAWWKPCSCFSVVGESGLFYNMSVCRKGRLYLSWYIHFLKPQMSQSRRFFFFPVLRSWRGKLGFITHLTYIKLSVHMMFFGPHYA